MIPGVVGRLVLFATIAFISVYFVFMMGMPIGIELPAYILEHHDPSLPKKVVRFYKEQVEERQHWLRRVLRDPSDEDGYLWLYNCLAPEVHCPQLARVGLLDAKTLCNPWRIPDKCTILSLGLGDDITFEKELQKMTNSRCRILGLDSNNPSNQTKDEFEDMHGKAEQTKLEDITDRARGQYTLVDLVEVKGIGPVEILKVEASTAGSGSLLPYLEEDPVPQLLVEIEGPAEKMLRLLTALSDQGYFLVDHSVNGKYHNVAEFTLIHGTAFRKYGVKILARYLDFVNRA